MKWIRVTPVGWFYVGMTVALGVVALVSANNVLYLLVSILLSGLGFSGWVSYRTIENVEVSLVRGQACAGLRVPDQIRLKNQSRKTLYYVFVYERKGRSLSLLARVERLAPHEELLVPSQQIFSQRGSYDWDGISIGTPMPFLFTYKYYPYSQAGSRKVWPERDERRIRLHEAFDFESSGVRSTGVQWIEGELRPYLPGDDLRGVVWSKSATGGEWWVRPKRSGAEIEEVTLDLRGPPPFEELERRVKLAAQPFHRAYRQGMSRGPKLRIETDQGTQQYSGVVPSLDALAVLQGDTP